MIVLRAIVVIGYHYNKKYITLIDFMLANAMKEKPLPPKLQAWIEARKKCRLSHAHIQMARELGLNPQKLGSINNHKQEPWKAPLPIFIETLYGERFNKQLQEHEVKTIEQLFQLQQQKKLPKSSTASKSN